MNATEIESATTNFIDYELRQVEIAIQQGDLPSNSNPLTLGWMMDSLAQHPADQLPSTCKFVPEDAEGWNVDEIFDDADLEVLRFNILMGLVWRFSD